MPRIQLACAVATTLGMLVGCTSFDDVNGVPPAEVTITSVPALVDITEEPAGANCPVGGQRIRTGQDFDRDDALDDNEVTDDVFVCDGDPNQGVTLAGLDCDEGEVAQFDGLSWSCGFGGDTLLDITNLCLPGQVPRFDGEDWGCSDATDTVGALDCDEGEIAKWNGFVWACAADQTVTAGSDTLSSLACGEDQVAKYNGSVWACADDIDTTIENTDVLASLVCADGQIPKRLGGQWLCGTDVDTDTDTLDTLDCAAGQVAEWTGFAWVCEVDDDSLGALACADGEVARFDGLAWDCAPDADALGALVCGAGEIVRSNGVDWTCDVDLDTLGALACGVGELPRYNGVAWTCDVETGNDTLSSLTCATDQIVRYNGAAWVCDVDVDTDTLAGLTGCTTGQVASWNGADWVCADDGQLDAATLWQLGGNAGTTPGADGLGTSDNVALELVANGARALRLEPNATSPNVLGGYSGNVAGADALGAFIGGGGSSGQTNAVFDPYGVIGGGRNNTAGNDNAAATEAYATVAGGESNAATGQHATVAGGANNTASGAGATVAGGTQNDATGVGSFAAGTRAKAVNNGAIVLADGTAGDFSSTAANQLAVRAYGGVRIKLDDACESNLSPADGLWTPTCTSDRSAKRGFTPVSGEEVLDRVAGLDISRWQYSGAPDVDHLGPMAQDFHAAFGLGADERAISMVDAAGVSLKAIQALEARTSALLDRTERLADENDALRAELDRLREALREGDCGVTP